MVTLEQVHLARGGEGTGLNFFIRDGSYTWKGYYIKKYHIFDPKTKKIIINDISKIKEKSNKEIEILELGSITQSTGFITDIPNCDLIRKRKPIFNSEDIFYIPSGESIGVNNYLGKNMRAFTRDKKLVCELYLPSTLFKKIWDPSASYRKIIPPINSVSIKWEFTPNFYHCLRCGCRDEDSKSDGKQ